MNTKVKGKASKAKGKAIVGIAMAAIMVASVMAAMIGSTGAYSNGTDYNIILNDGGATVQSVIIGQNLDFYTHWGPTIVTIARVKDPGVELWTKKADPENHLTIAGDDWKKEGAFYVNYKCTGAGATLSCSWDAQLSFSDPDMPLDLKVITEGKTKVVSGKSIAVGTKLTIDTGGMNLFLQDKVDLIVIGPDGQIKTDEKNTPPQKFTNISVDDLTSNFGADNLKTTGWTIGDYTFQIKTKSDYACGLDAASGTIDLKIIKGAIEIEAETTQTVELTDITLTVTGVAGDEIRVKGDCINVIFNPGLQDTPTSAKNHPSWFDDTIDGDGVRKYSVQFDDTGTYTIRVDVTGPVIIPPNPRIGDYETVDITVSEKGVTFDMPISVVVGERVTIKGTATSGTYVSVYVDDTLWRQLENLTISDGEFSKEVLTTEVGMNIPGTVRLKAWIDCDAHVPPTLKFTVDKCKPSRTADGDEAILLTTPDLKAELSPVTVALEDDFWVKGTAPGTKQVTILCVPPKGGGGKSLTTEGVKGIVSQTASVSTTDHTFSRKLSVQDNANTGYYDIYVLSPGMDGKWDMTGESNLETALCVRYRICSLEAGKDTCPGACEDIGTKSQENIYSILDDMVHCAGSDDLMWLGKLKVETAFVTLDPISAVGIGEPLVVTGKSNRKDGFPIVVTCKGPVELDPQTVKLENETFTVTFDTSKAKVGEYLVKADDGDGHTDEKTVGISETKPTPPPTTPVPTPTATPSVPPEPTATPVPTPTPTPPPTPGFEAVFAIAGLLAVAYLVLRRRK